MVATSAKRRGAPSSLARRHNAAEILAADVLHGEVVGVTVLAEVVDVDDVRVIEAGGELGLVEEHGDEVGLLGQVRQDALERHALLEAVGA